VLARPDRRDSRGRVARIAALAAARWLAPGIASRDVQAPGAAAIITLRNDGADPLNAQIRVFRWVQVNGEERLEPTDDVVASPPITTMAPRTNQTVRLVRVTKRPAAAGESYRLLVDELPEAKARQQRAVAIVVRYSIPVFFYPRDAAAARLTWSLGRSGGRDYITATNDGDRHVRVSALNLHDASGATISLGNGLAGYVLGRSTMRWAVPGNSQRLNPANSIMISAQGDSGPIHASLATQPVR
jgi:fimbrial chaperone protein